MCAISAFILAQCNDDKALLKNILETGEAVSQAIADKYQNEDVRLFYSVPVVVCQITYMDEEKEYYLTRYKKTHEGHRRFGNFYS